MGNPAGGVEVEGEAEGVHGAAVGEPGGIDGEHVLQLGPEGGLVGVEDGDVLPVQAFQAPGRPPRRLAQHPVPARCPAGLLGHARQLGRAEELEERQGQRQVHNAPVLDHLRQEDAQEPGVEVGTARRDPMKAEVGGPEEGGDGVAGGVGLGIGGREEAAGQADVEPGRLLALAQVQRLPLQGLGIFHQLVSGWQSIDGPSLGLTASASSLSSQSQRARLFRCSSAATRA